MQLQDERNKLETDFQSQKANYENKIKYYQHVKEKNKEDYDDMMRKFETTVKTLGRERDKYKEKSSNDFKSLADQHEEDIKALKD